MTPDRASTVVDRWVRFYTRDLPLAVAERRVEEIGSDLIDHVAHERARGTPDRVIALSVLSRMARGMHADITWRRHIQPSRGDSMKPLLALMGAALGVALIALILDSPALILLSILGVVGVSLGTFLISARTAQEGDFLLPYVAIVAGALALAALAVTAIVFGERGDAPGLVLFGVVLVTSVVVGAFALGMRTARRSTD